MLLCVFKVDQKHSDMYKVCTRIDDQGFYMFLKANDDRKFGHVFWHKNGDNKKMFHSVWAIFVE